MMRVRTLLQRGWWVFYVWAVIEAFSVCNELTYFVHRNQPGIRRINWVSAAEMTGLAALAVITANGLRRGRTWAVWLAAAQAVFWLLSSPGVVIALGFFGACVAAGAFMWRRAPKAVVLPLIFLVMMAPFGIFVASGAGTHMTPLLLYPFALPWCLIPFNEYPPGFEVRLLFLGCALNTVILGGIGFALDRRARGNP